MDLDRGSGMERGYKLWRFFRGSRAKVYKCSLKFHGRSSEAILRSTTGIIMRFKLQAAFIIFSIVHLIAYSNAYNIVSMASGVLKGNCYVAKRGAAL